MRTGIVYQTKKHEQELIRVVRRLPPERVAEVIDFAQFLELRSSAVHEDAQPNDVNIRSRIAEENARWDALLASAESQHLLEKMADEALAEIQAGLARPMVFTEDGEIAPG